MKRLYKISLICGVAPLVIGVIIFLAWYFTLWDKLLLLGIFTIYGAFTMVIIGIICLAIYLLRQFRINHSFSRNIIKQGLFSGSILFANFPVAVIIVILVIKIATTFTVVVTNKSGAIIDNFVLTGPGVNINMGQIVPNENAKHSFHVAHDGVLKFKARQKDNEIEGIVESYVTSGMGGKKLIIVDLKKRFTVKDIP